MSPCVRKPSVVRKFWHSYLQRTQYRYSCFFFCVRRWYYPATAWAVSVPTTAWGGGGVGSDPPPLLSRKRIDVERRTRRHSKDLDETLPNHFRKFKIEVTCQVKVRSKVKIGCFQVADRSDLKRSIFRPKLSICTPKDQAKVLTSEIVSYLAQVKVKVRSEKVTKPKIFKCVVWHMFYGPFWTKNSIVTVILQFDLIWTKKMRKSIQGQVKNFKKGKFSKFIFFENKDMFLKKNLLSNPMVPLVFL